MRSHGARRQVAKLKGQTAGEEQENEGEDSVAVPVRITGAAETAEGDHEFDPERVAERTQEHLVPINAGSERQKRVPG